jgi:tyrosyl-tRNA synthetase
MLLSNQMHRLDDLLTRGVANIIPRRVDLEELLNSGKKINVYLGIDPTSTHIHLGHAVPLRKLQILSDLGHHITFLIGDFTALIGDTSDKDSERPVLTPEQIEENFATYQKQASKILDFSKITVRHNSEWLKTLDYAEIIKLTRHFSLNDFISREMIKKRLEAGRSVSLPEVMYPVMQGYDSYFMDTDLQIGGTDQTFNMQAGRTLQKALRNKESFVLTTVFLEGTDGRKMSKSWGNAIWLDDSPKDIYGKIMSLRDDLIEQYYTLATNVSKDIIFEVVNRLHSGENPMALKKELAFTIVSELHSPEAAGEAQKHFETTVQAGQVPADLPEFSPASYNLIDILTDSKLASSNSTARRLIDQGGVKIDGTRVNEYEISVPAGSIISVGPLRHLKVK